MSRTTTTETPAPLATASRAVVHRTRGSTQGPVTRPMSPGDLGQAQAHGAAEIRRIGLSLRDQGQPR